MKPPAVRHRADSGEPFSGMGRVPAKVVAIHVNVAKKSLVLAVAPLVVLAIGPTPVAASANACIYPHPGAPGIPTVMVPVAGAWATGTSIGTHPTCASGVEFFMPSVACGAAGTSPGPAVYCGMVVAAGAPVPMATCTATYLGSFPGWTGTPPGGISVIGIAAGWDFTGPTGLPDGHVDGWESAPAGFGVALALGPAGPTYSTTVGMPIPVGPAQLIAWPLATDTMPAGMSALLGERVHVGCV